MIKDKVKLLQDKEITKDNVKEFLNSLFYIIRNEKRGTNLSDTFDDALDACVGGHTGVMLLNSELQGTGYNLVKNKDGKPEYVKREPKDCKIIYLQALELIKYLDSLIELEQQKSKDDVSREL